MSHRTSSLCTLLTAAFVVVSVVVSVAAPGVSAQLSAEKEVEFPEGFGLLSNVRELPDGRVLVADPLGQILAALDMEAGTMDMWGREGGGPREYRQPDAVHALPGDSTLLVDLGNARLTVIAPDGSFVRTRPIALGGTPTPGRGPGMQMAIPRVVDGSGRIYFPVRNFQNPGDSSSIARVGVGSDAVETVARFKPRDVQQSESGGRISIQARPMSPEDDWAVGVDGTIALVRADDYHIDVVHPDGRISNGPEVDHSRIRPRDAEKQAWLDEASSSGLTVRMSISGGQQQLQISRGGQGSDRSINDLDWPDRMPSFRTGSSRIDPEGRIWVGRTTRAGEPSLFDVFDGEGRPIAQVSLDPNSSIVGFGEDGALYTTRTDFVGLQWLQRRRVR